MCGARVLVTAGLLCISCGNPGRITFDDGRSEGDRDGNVVVERDGPPVADDLGLETTCNTAVTARLHGVDPEGAPVSYAIVAAPTHGVLGDIEGDTVVYTPAEEFHGTDGFSYRATDGLRWSEPAHVTVLVHH